MRRLFDRLLGRTKAAAEDQDALRAEFRHRYHHFRRLLESDLAAHECLVSIEDALHGGRVFGMRFVRSVATRAATATYQVVRHLCAIAPDRYEALYERFAAIQAEMLPHIEPRYEPGGGPLTVDLAGLDRGAVPQAGAKMAHLGEAASALGLTVPEGFVVTAEAYRAFMAEDGLRDEILRRIQAAGLDEPGSSEEALLQLSSSLQQLVIDAPLPETLAREIMGRLERMDRGGAPLRVALRSSGLEEDAAGTAFAGQYESVLNLSPEEALLGYKTVVASKYRRQAMSYRLARGIREEDVAMCVGVMRMVDAEAGGVAYSAGPLDAADRDVRVYSVWGLPKAVVDGAGQADLYRFSRGEPPRLVSRDIASKDTRFECRPDEGTCAVRAEDQRREQPSLSDERALDVARLALALERRFGAPQDVEWALDRRGRVILLQTRTLVRPSGGYRGGLRPGEVPPGGALLAGGDTASPGAACGPVFPARSQADLLLFPEGAVLAVRQALPSWAPLLARAAGVVSEMGGPAGHLANVAREFGVPALFGVPGALDALKPGALVTLDADGRAVYPGRVAALMDREPVSCPVRRGPVHASLAGAARHILPLHLLDPESPSFRPSECRSLHDIVRFCHEKSVREMFSFGQDRRFPQAAARQLYHGQPKQFWIVNLDDGFAGEVGDRFVQLQDIVSRPMLALWAGMNAVPWGGPPPVNARGLLAVMFEATANPSLDPSMASHYTQRNFFMISKNFASLQSRFGFHFCGVETLVGERVAENYALFNFQGGAADHRRRVLRTRLIADLLQERDFRVRLHGDALTARAEGFDEAGMLLRLRALGHLITHTRQLDMVMGDPAEAERRGASLRAGLDDYFQRGEAAAKGA